MKILLQKEKKNTINIFPCKIFCYIKTERTTASWQCRISLQINAYSRTQKLPLYIYLKAISDFSIVAEEFCKHERYAEEVSEMEDERSISVRFGGDSRAPVAVAHCRMAPRPGGAAGGRLQCAKDDHRN